MKKTLFLFLVLGVFFMPLSALASIGPLDQYGGHICAANCADYNLAEGEYHFHSITSSPDFLSGYIKKPAESYFYFLPLVKTVLFDTANTPRQELVENSSLDDSYCGGLGLFAKGLYTKDNLIRVKPVCADKETAVMTNTVIVTNLYYKEIPNDNSDSITKLYHYTSPGPNRDVFTDRPAASELVGKIVQSETDTNMYYVQATATDVEMRKIGEGTAQFMYGMDYKNHIIYLADGLLTFKVGSPL